MSVQGWVEERASWADKAKYFSKVRENIKSILEVNLSSKHPLDMAQLYNFYKNYYRSLPDLERRMRELVDDYHEVEKIEGPIPRYRIKNV